MKGQVITAARRGAAWCRSLVPGVLRSAPHAQKGVDVASVAGPLMKECFGPLKEPRASEDGCEGKKCVCLVVSATRGMKHVSKTLLNSFDCVHMGNSPVLDFFFFSLGHKKHLL